MNKLWCAVTLSLALTMIPSGSAQAGGDDIGVIMGSEGCPNGAAPLWIYIDNEGHNNANSRGGWIGATVSTSNTQFNFCRISGNQLRWPGEPYMVLSLGSSCPAGTFLVIRRFDADDTSESSATNINWQAEGLPLSIINDDSDVRMFFCAVDDAGTQSGSLPNIGVEYGVFATSDFPALATGFVYTDDEDRNVSGNSNAWCDGSCGFSDFGFRSYYLDSSIIYGNENTHLNIAKVSGSVCGNGRCGSGETCASCPTDCGTCPVCPDSVCSGSESCWSCAADCGACSVCGDGICGQGESCLSCCFDCGVCNPSEACSID